MGSNYLLVGSFFISCLDKKSPANPEDNQELLVIFLVNYSYC